MRFLRVEVFPETWSGPKKISPKYGIFLSTQKTVSIDHISQNEIYDDF